MTREDRKSVHSCKLTGFDFVLTQLSTPGSKDGVWVVFKETIIPCTLACWVWDGNIANEARPIISYPTRIHILHPSADSKSLSSLLVSVKNEETFKRRILNFKLP